MGQQLNPDDVPAYPQYVIDYDEDAETARLDGVPIEPAAGVGLREAALNAASTKAQEHGLDAVRVTVRATTGEQWKMIVDVDGPPVDVTPAPEATKTGSKRRKRLIIGLTGSLLAAAVTAGTITAVTLTSEEPETEAPQWEIPGPGEQIPVGLPAGYEGPADWSVTIAGPEAAATLADGSIVTGNDEGIMTARDPQTAEPVWAGSNAPSDLSEVHETTWAGTEVLATEQRGNMRVWNTEETTPGEATAPTEIPLSNNGTALWEGDTPLISLGDFIVLLPNGDGELDEITIPAGSQPLLAEDGEAVSIGADAIYRTPAEGEHSSTDFTPPQDATGQPDALWALGTEAFVAVWNEDDPLLSVIDLDTGERITSDIIDRSPTEDTSVIHDPDAQRAVIGTTSINYGENANVNEIESLDAPVIHGNTLYGISSDGPATVDLTQVGAEADTYSTFTDSDTAPVVVADDAVYVPAPRLEETMFYRAPAVEESTENGDSE